MLEDFSFLPNRERALSLDAGMRGGLADSLEYLAEAARAHMAFDAERLNARIAQMRSGQRFSPSTFADYYDLVPALATGDPTAANALFAAICEAEPMADGLHVAAFGHGDLAGETDRFARMMKDAEDEGAPDILPPSVGQAEAFAERLSLGLELLDAAAPLVSGEIRAIVSQIVIVRGAPEKEVKLDGGSHYRLWGALFLNADFHPTRLAMAEVLAHEASHSLLFGFCLDEALTKNDDEARYASPLRLDPRPMEGIYHATFVSARMYWAMRALSSSLLLTPVEQADARRRAEEDAVNFRAGLAVLRADAGMTNVGAGLMDAASAYMKSVGALEVD